MPTSDEDRPCSRCKESLPRAAFGKDSKMRDGLRSHCRKCHAAYARNWKDANPDKFSAGIQRRRQAQRNYFLQRSYGISIDQFEAMLAGQNGKCAICGSNDPGGTGTFHVDHCHETGRIRGLLCAGCNLGLGSLGDTIEDLSRALSYLSRKGLIPQCQ